VGSCSEEVAQAVCQTLMDRPAAMLDSPFARFFGLTLGLVYLGQQERVYATLEVLNVVEHPIKRFALEVAEGFAYAGSGNVLKIQKHFQTCAEQPVENSLH